MSDAVVGMARQRAAAGDLAGAARLLADEVKRRPRHAGLRREAARLSEAAGLIAQAGDALKAAVELEPGELDHVRALSEFLGRQGRFDEAVTACRKALSRLPQRPEAYIHLADALLAARQAEEAVDVTRRLLEIAPDRHGSREWLAMVLERIGRVDEAEAEAKRVLASVPGQPGATLTLAKLAKRRGNLPGARTLLEAIDALPNTPDALAGDALVDLGGVLERQGEYDRAFEAYRRAQARLYAALPESDRDPRPYLSAITTARAFALAGGAAGVSGVSGGSVVSGGFAGWKQPPPDKFKDPVFIVGFPRSGTTLLEQVFAAHPGLVTTDESPILQSTRKALNDRFKFAKPYPDVLHAMTGFQVSAGRQMYFDLARRAVGPELDNKRLVDKQPLNTVDLPLVRRLFPRAKVVYMVRDPRDTVLSCFTQSFARGMPHFFDLEATARLYATLDDLWAVYRETLGLDSLELRYEDLVDSFAEVSRRVIGFVGETWDPGVERFHERAGRRFIVTPTYQDVSRPVYKTAMGRWTRFEGHLRPVLDMLEVCCVRWGYPAQARDGQ